MSFSRDQEQSWRIQSTKQSYIVNRGLGSSQDDYENNLTAFRGDSLCTTIEKKITAAAGRHPISIFDAGCGEGDFLLDAAQKWGRSVTLSGVSAYPYHEEKPDKREKIAANNITITIENLEKYQRQSVHDVIASVYALGYVFDPIGTLIRLYAALKPGGVAYIYPFSFRSQGKKDGEKLTTYLENRYGFDYQSPRSVAFEKTKEELRIPAVIADSEEETIIFDKVRAVYRFNW